MKNPANYRWITLFFLGVLLTFSCLHTEARADTPRKDIETALIGGIGTGKIPEGNYQPLLMIWHWGLDMKRYFSGLENHRGRLSVFLEPQFNPAISPDDNFEFGVGMGIQYRYPVTERLWGYLLGAAGPHYITLVSTCQENGFIFSDTLGGGLYYFLGENTALKLGYRWRHMSNADLALPNGGINTNFFTLGYAFFF